MIERSSCALSHLGAAHYTKIDDKMIPYNDKIIFQNILIYISYIQITLSHTKIYQPLLFNTDDNLILYDDITLYKIILICNFSRLKLPQNLQKITNLVANTIFL